MTTDGNRKDGTDRDAELEFRSRQLDDALASRREVKREAGSDDARSESAAGFAQALRLSDLPDRLHEFDAVVSCTASSLPIIGLGAVERALKARRRRVAPRRHT